MSKVGSAVPKWDRTFSACEEKKGEGEPPVEKKIKMQKVSTWSIGVTCILAVLFAFVSIVGQKEFQVLETATDQYIAC